MDSEHFRLPDIYHAHEETIQAAHDYAIDQQQQQSKQRPATNPSAESFTGEVTTRTWPEQAVRVANMLATHPSLIHLADDGSVIVMNYPGQFGRR